MKEGSRQAGAPRSNHSRSLPGLSGPVLAPAPMNRVVQLLA